MIFKKKIRNPKGSGRKKLSVASTVIVFRVRPLLLRLIDERWKNVRRQFPTMTRGRYVREALIDYMQRNAQ